jgi:hypothetical protein
MHRIQRFVEANSGRIGYAAQSAALDAIYYEITDSGRAAAIAAGF